MKDLLANHQKKKERKKKIISHPASAPIFINEYSIYNNSILDCVELTRSF